MRGEGRGGGEMMLFTFILPDFNEERFGVLILFMC